MADHNDDPRRALLDDDVPPIRRGPGRVIIFGSCAAILFVLLTVVVMSLDREYNLDGQRSMDDDLTELIAPRPLDDIDPDQDGFDFSRDLQPELAQGGWVQIANEHGELARQYRCKRLDPNPEGMPRGWLWLEDPELEVYLSDNRVVTLTGNEALVYAPHNLLETGTITGDVIVRMFEGEPDRPVNVRRDEPSMRVTTDEASFENFMGEIHCPDWVRIESDRLELPGKDLRLLVNDRDNTVQLYIREHDYIRIVKVPDEPATAAHRLRRESHESPRAIPASYSPDDRPAGSLQPAPAADDDATFYLLTIKDDVRIMQGERAARRTASGEQLEVAFSMQTRGIDAPLATALPTLDLTPARTAQHPIRDASLPHTGPLPLHQLVASLAWAHPGNYSSDDDESLLGPDITLIRSSGPLSIVPLKDPTRRPASAEDARVELHGKPVRMCDLARQTEASGTILRYHTEGEEVELIGDEFTPLRVDSPDMQAGGERFHLAQAEGHGAFTGAGWMTHRPGRVLRDLHCGGLAHTTVAATVEHQLDREPAPLPSAADEEPELHITWDDGVDLTFSDGQDGSASGRLKRADFSGNVKVLTNDLTLDADDMTVTFPQEPGRATDRDSIESIHARGSVRVQGIGAEGGSILCEDLHFQLKQTDDGSTVPDTMLAKGDVQAIDDEQIIWSDTLHVWFAPPEVGANVTERAHEGTDRWREDVDVSRVEAEGNVEILLEDGTRAYADRLEGDGIAETVELLGDNVVIASDNVIMDHGTRVVLNRKNGTATAPGKGRFRSFQRPILDERDRSRQPRPVAQDDDDNRIEMRIAWTERMHYDSTTNDGAGSIDFEGDVDGESAPSPLELDTITAQTLRLDFERADDESFRRDPSGERSSPNDEQVESHTDDARARREVRTMIATGDARLESQVWADAERTEDPRIFYVAGNHVQYDRQTEHALVEGKGELLIHDVSAPSDNAAQQQTPFGSRGTTMMTWTHRLEMTRMIDDLYKLTSEGEIELRHRDLDDELSWLTCERLEATIRRAVPDGDDVQRAVPGRSGIDFGGSAELQHVRGEGGVIIRTDQREVDCDTFDYNVTTGMAVLHAAPGRRIAITTRGTPGVMLAEQAIWNMERDTIRITRAAGDTPE